MKVEGSLLRNMTKAVRAYTGYGISEQKKRREAMADLFKDFQDWLAYNHPEVKLEPTRRPCENSPTSLQQQGVKGSPQGYSERACTASYD